MFVSMFVRYTEVFCEKHEKRYQLKDKPKEVVCVQEAILVEKEILKNNALIMHWQENLSVQYKTKRNKICRVWFDINL